MTPVRSWLILNEIATTRRVKKGPFFMSFFPDFSKKSLLLSIIMMLWLAKISSPLIAIVY
jgi:hypothetical protein